MGLMTGEMLNLYLKAVSLTENKRCVVLQTGCGRPSVECVGIEP
jgi:hypothetical protein